MKNKFFTKALMVFLALFGFKCGAFAQSEVFNQGNMIINAGIGAGSWIAFDNDNSGYSMKLFPIVASFEYGVADLFDSRGGIGIGGYTSYTSFAGRNNKAGLGVSDLIVGARGLFHYEFLENLDTYAGVMLGFDVKLYPQKDADLPGSKLYPGFFLGARYYVTNNFGFFGEVGLNSAPLEVGVCYIF